MALNDADMQRIAELIRSEVADLRGELEGGEYSSDVSQAPELSAEAARAITPLARTVGNWNLASTRSGGAREATGPDSPVEFDRFENNLHAGGRVMVTTFSGRFREGAESAAEGVQAGAQFGGFFALAYDAANNRYMQLYADDLGKVAYNATERWEVDGETLRLFFDEEESGGFVAEFATDGPAQMTYNLFSARRGGRGTEAARGTLIKSTTLRRQ